MLLIQLFCLNHMFLLGVVYQDVSI